MRPLHHSSLGRDCRATATVEFALVVPVFLVFLFGVMEFAFVMAQWSAAAKATQAGARLAAVSDPVAPGLSTYMGDTAAATPGTACQSDAGTLQPHCSLGSAVVCRQGSCTGGMGYSQTAFDRIATRVRAHWFGLSEFDPADNLEIEYAVNGLGFVGRPGGLPYTVTVRLTGASYDFLLLDDLVRLAGGALAGSLPMPEFATAVVAEDLSSAAPAAPAR